MGIKQKLVEKQPVIGSWVQSGSPVIAEIMAFAGLDFVAADMEHSDIDERGFVSFARALHGKTEALARVPANSTISIRRVLDGGAAGVIVPLVNTAADAQKAVAATRYPPGGIRGYAYCRANGWGRNFDEYAAGFNDRVLLVVMVETRQAVDNIEEILAVEGVDGVLIGPYDLSGSFGAPGQLESAQMQQAKKRVLQACLRHGKAAGQHIVTPTKALVQQALEEGYTFLPLGMDTVFISNGIAEIQAMANAGTGTIK